MTTKTVDLTPTWQGILPALLNLLQSDNPRTRELAEAEMYRMARSADRMIAHLNSTEK